MMVHSSSDAQACGVLCMLYPDCWTFSPAYIGCNVTNMGAVITSAPAPYLKRATKQYAKKGYNVTKSECRKRLSVQHIFYAQAVRQKCQKVQLFFFVREFRL